MKRRWVALVIGLLALLGSGCLSLSEIDLSARELPYPVSLTPAIVDPDGVPRTPPQEEIVGHFRREWRHWAMAWGSLDLTTPVDLAALLEEEITKVNGNGVVNLTFGAQGSGMSWVTSLLLIFPENVKVTVEGDVIRTPEEEE